MVEQMLARMKVDDPPACAFSQVCLAERLIGLDLVQRLFIPGKQAGKWSVDTELAEMLAPEFMKIMIGEARWKEIRKSIRKLPQKGFDAAAKEVNDFFDDIERWSDMPYYQVTTETHRLEQLTKETTSPLIAGLDMFLRARVVGERSSADRRATHLILHLFVHRGRTGAFPATLDELGLPKSAEIRIDPFSGRG